MRLPPFARYIIWLRMTGALILGAIIGIAIHHSLVLAQFERLVNEKNDLEFRIAQYIEDIHHLNQYQNKHTVIKSIKVRIEEEGGSTSSKPVLDRLSESELIKRFKEDLSSFHGQSIYEIDSDARLARKMLERKIYTDVYGKDYAIELKTMLVVENVLQVWIQVRSYAKPPT